MEKLELIIEHLENKPALVDFFYELLNLNKYPSKRELLELFSNYDTDKIDSAFPIMYFREIQAIYPGIKDALLCYNYNRDDGEDGFSFGSMLNINDLVADKLISVLSENK